MQCAHSEASLTKTFHDSEKISSWDLGILHISCNGLTTPLTINAPFLKKVHNKSILNSIQI